jgi:hypothetical protein
MTALDRQIFYLMILKEQTSKEMAVPGDWVVIAKLQA